MAKSAFRGELESVINRNSKENGSNTPDFILAQFLIGCLEAFDEAVNARTNWYEPADSNGGGGDAPTPPVSAPPSGAPRA